MDFANFTMLVREELEKKVGDHCQVKLHDVRKNNGVVLKGITMMQENNNITPTIYLNNLYDDYKTGITSIDNVIDDVISTYNRNKISHRVDMQYLLDYERIKHKIVYKLVNTEKNSELLKDVPHKEFLDLSIIFKCLISDSELGEASVLIHNVNMKMWNVTVEDLYQAAKENTPRILKYEIKRMMDVLYEIMNGAPEFEHDECMAECSDSVPMYVLSNRNKVDGAACLLYPDLIQDFADAIGGSYYIIPSSIHEVLLLPAEHEEDSAEIKSMIREINDTQVITEEILSYSLYFYDRGERKIIKL